MGCRYYLLYKWWTRAERDITDCLKPNWEAVGKAGNSCRDSQQCHSSRWMVAASCAQVLCAAPRCTILECVGSVMISTVLAGHPFSGGRDGLIIFDQSEICANHLSSCSQFWANLLEAMQSCQNDIFLIESMMFTSLSCITTVAGSHIHSHWGSY